VGIETMMIAAAVAGAAGTALDGASQFADSRYRSAVLKNQADAARRDAGIEVQLNLEDSGRDLAVAQTIAAKGGGGIEGSALNVMRDLSRQGIYEVQRIAVEGDNASRAAMADAKQAKRQGDFALAGSLIKAGAQLAGASNGMGDGTILTDKIAARAKRGTPARRTGPTSYGRPLAW